MLPTLLVSCQIDNHLPVIFALFPVLCWLGGGAGRGGVGTWRRFDRRHSWVTSSLGFASQNSSQIKPYRLRDGSRVSIPEVPCHAQAFNQMTLENEHPCAGGGCGGGVSGSRPYSMLVFLAGPEWGARPEGRRAKTFWVEFAQMAQHHGQRPGPGVQRRGGEGGTRRGARRGWAAGWGSSALSHPAPRTPGAVSPRSRDAWGRRKGREGGSRGGRGPVGVPLRPHPRGPGPFLYKACSPASTRRHGRRRRGAFPRPELSRPECGR